MKRSVILLAAAVALVVGCEPVPHYNRVQVAGLTGEPVKVASSQQGKIKTYGSVKLYNSKAEVTEKYKTIAILTVSGDPGDEARFITAFLYRAADLGADAVVMDRQNGGTVSTAVNMGWIPTVQSVGSFRAEAIRFEKNPQ